MYYIYEIPGVKIGCTDNTHRRVELAQKTKDYKILEEHTNIYRASYREIKLQKQFGYPVDKVPYFISSKVHEFRTEESFKQSALNHDYKELGKNTSKRQKGKLQPQLHTKEAMYKKQKAKIGKAPAWSLDPIKCEKVQEKKRIKVNQYSLEGQFLKSWNSVKDAEGTLNIWSGGISRAAKKGKLSGGFYWEYV